MDWCTIFYSSSQGGGHRLTTLTPNELYKSWCHLLQQHKKNISMEKFAQDMKDLFLSILEAIKGSKLSSAGKPHYLSVFFWIDANHLLAIHWFQEMKMKKKRSLNLWRFCNGCASFFLFNWSRNRCWSTDLSVVDLQEVIVEERALKDVKGPTRPTPPKGPPPQTDWTILFPFCKNF